MEFFTITKDGYELEIIDGTIIKLLNFAYNGSKPVSVSLKQIIDGKNVNALLCTLTPKQPQYSSGLIIVGEKAEFVLDGDDDVTVFISVDLDDELMDFDDDDEMDYADMEDESIEEEIPKKEQKKPQPPKKEIKPKEPVKKEAKEQTKKDKKAMKKEEKANKKSEKKNHHKGKKH
ncbi:Nucleoplasmin-like domain-containing protein [Entamoeba marina]